ncbi:VTT domain-containing protein [Nocardia sp. NBC_01503]|uniref:DedA family protein n=1 Tax=Nocardia sp. NBC_01503 TaxID=2975997 RepID=UPI002E7BA8A5|nr:VTT domain-containing protein [Nocardia sp. NBC_01503]WTL36261.1 VTT domain-containing protein [Nocardia sp. NBC_01503]
MSDAVTTNVALPAILDPMHLLTETWLKNAVLPAILVIVFIETGLLFPILPGDSLLFTGGLLSAQSNPPVSIWVLLPAVILIAFLGDQSGYWIGRAIGPALFQKEDSRFFKKKYVTETHEFFEKYGPKTIILARFVPIVRTFMPVLAGVSKMDYRKFVTFDIVGAILWGGGVTVLGYFLGNVEFIRKNVEAIFLLIVFVSILPGIVTVVKNLRGRGAVEQELAATSNEPNR